MFGLQAGWGVEIGDAEATFRALDGYRRCVVSLGRSAVVEGLTGVFVCLCVGLRGV